jgi:hypothetical protein
VTIAKRHFSLSMKALETRLESGKVKKWKQELLKFEIGKKKFYQESHVGSQVVVWKELNVLDFFLYTNYLIHSRSCRTINENIHK